MSFSDLSFLFRFLPVFMIVYGVSPPKWRRYAIVLSSFAFAAFSSVWAVALLGMPVMVNCFLGRFVRRSKWVLYAGVGLDVAFLAACRLIPLPLPGVSYLMFSLISYLIDVSRETVAPARVGLFTAYGTLFPRMVTGPITRAGDILPQLEQPKCTPERVERGAGLLILGLGYKVLLADALSGLWSAAGKIGYESLSMPMAWLCAIGFSLQLYFDFHGCTLMAVGLGRMMGVKLPENFDFPYLSRSVSEFYRRWHITLGMWFRDYVYIPLGGSRKGTRRTLVNLAAVWLLTGLWHGLHLNFLIWGAFLCLWIALEKLGLRNMLDRHVILSHVYLLFVIVLSWVIFAVNTPGELLTYFFRLFCFGYAPAGSFVDPMDWMRYLPRFAPYLIAGVFFSLPFGERAIRKYQTRWPVRVLLFLIFWCAAAKLSVLSGTPFLYAQF
ncbi:MAG: MBOAT family protein [Eubacteriales bacterium]|nr:MBOAT family protein [Eubacteriales bacterium]